MERNDKQAIESLFAKLEAVERDAAPRDPEAETYIEQMVGRQPGAPYYMAQTIVVQEQALEAAQARIEELEQQTRSGAIEDESSRGGVFAKMFGGRQSTRSGGVPRVSRTAPLSQQDGYRQESRGGGFLAGAAQTAMGVAGGVLLGNAIAGMFGGTEAQAAEAPDQTAADADPQTEDSNVQDASYDDGGSDSGAGFDEFGV